MHLKNSLVVVLGLVLLAGVSWALLAGDGGGGPALVTWDPADEVPLGEEEIPPDALEAELADQGLERVELEAVEPPTSRDPRELGVRGRVLDSYGRPLAAAQVVLEIGGRRGRRGGGRSRIRKPVETGRDGRFEFRGQGVPGSSISLHLTHASHAPEIVDRQFEDGATDLDVGDLQMVAGAFLMGSIVNKDGVGIPGATAQLSPQRGNRLTWARNRNELLKPVRTDRNGFFRIAHLRPGDYRIDASAPNHTRASSEVISLADLDEEELDPIMLGPGYQITGTVFSAEGAPVAGAELSLSPGRAGRERSDEQGRFTFDHLPARTVDLRVRADGYVTYDQRGIETAESPTLVVRLQGGLSITGIVTDGRTGAPVTSYAARARRVGQLPEQDQGQRLERMRQDAQRLEQMMAEIAKRRAAAETSAAAEEMRRAGQELQALRAKTMALRAQMREVETSSREREFRRGRGRGGNRPGSAGDVQDRPGGEFSFQGLDEGIYVVDVESPAHQSTRTEPVELRVGGGSPRLQVVLERGIHVAGVVTSKADGRPLADARVELRTPPEQRNGGGNGPEQRFVFAFRGRGRGSAVVTARTDGQGRYELRHAPPGRYVVAVRVDGHAEASSEEFELRADRTDVNFELGRLAALRGIVAGIPEGRHGEVRVMAFGGPGNMKSARVESDGSYTLDDLGPGGYAVRAHLGSMRSFLSRELRTLMAAAQQGTTVFDVTLAEGEERTFDPQLDIPAVGDVVGTLLHNGVPAKGFNIRLQAVETEAVTPPGGPRESRRWRFLDGGFRNQTRTNQDGEFSFREVPEGAYKLIVYSPQDRRRELLTQDVYVQRESRNEQRLSVMTAALEGEVHAADGAPAAELDGNIRLYAGVLERPQDPRAFARENTVITVRVRDGRFEAPEIPVGDYLLELSVRGRERVEQPLSLGAGTRHLQLTAK